MPTSRACQLTAGVRLRPRVLAAGNPPPRHPCADHGSCKSHQTAWTRPCKPPGMSPSPDQPIPSNPQKSNINSRDLPCLDRPLAVCRISLCKEQTTLMAFYRQPPAWHDTSSSQQS
eukprot:354533-Chlamydomonas_euryale.AAC.9